LPKVTIGTMANRPENSGTSTTLSARCTKFLKYAREFDPKALKLLQQHLIGEGVAGT